eukprot:CAMPEP_0185753436 /NCGR_PEP_ID=MMETSP1174-20130828/12160_1 /TAXON_ID=35687 /ORGANISM="Dictyocha speculum, Strain CCMP1381" /LENGTH=116 /DNA_ID=CAMNT_0028431277 /DNA_START=1 /DNA_END=351 /DNA_ORIENTATION=-
MNMGVVPHRVGLPVDVDTSMVGSMVGRKRERPMGATYVDYNDYNIEQNERFANLGQMNHTTKRAFGEEFPAYQLPNTPSSWQGEQFNQWFPRRMPVSGTSKYQAMMEFEGNCLQPR